MNVNKFLVEMGIDEDKTNIKLKDDYTVGNAMDDYAEAVIKEQKKFFFAQDDSSHWYKIPVELKEIWDELAYKEDGWEDDRWQQLEDCSVGGCISVIIFSTDE